MDSDQDNQFLEQEQYDKQIFSEDGIIRKDQYESQSEQDKVSDNDSMEEVQLSDREKLEVQLLKEAITREKPTPYQESLTSDIVEKLGDLEEASLNKVGQELVNIRIQQLTFNKLLVLNYSRSNFRIVLSHYHLGQAYLSYNCIEQAIEHITLAIHKNEKIFNEMPKAQILQIYMQVALSQAYMSQTNYDDAIDLLDRTKTIEENVQKMKERDRGEYDKKNIRISILKAQCLCKIKIFDQAVRQINDVIKYIREKKLSKIEYAFSLVEKASIEAEIDTPQNYENAIQAQQQAINILVDENYSKPESVAQLYSSLSGYYQKVGNNQNQLTCIQKMRTLYEELYSPEDKKVIKARRKIATSLLKSERYKEAVTQLLEIAKLEEKVFGQTLQLARTLKLLGTVYTSLEIGDARVYLKRAMTIFQNLGSKKQALEIKEKIKSLINQNNGEIGYNMMSQLDI